MGSKLSPGDLALASVLGAAVPVALTSAMGSRTETGTKDPPDEIENRCIHPPTGLVDRPYPTFPELSRPSNGWTVATRIAQETRGLIEVPFQINRSWRTASSDPYTILVYIPNAAAATRPAGEREGAAARLCRERIRYTADLSGLGDRLRFDFDCGHLISHRFGKFKLRWVSRKTQHWSA
jgi:hypothetical protein